MAPAPRRAIQLALTVAILALLWHLVDGEAALRQLLAAHPAWVGASIALLTLQTVLSALRWRLTAGRLGIALGRSTAIREYYLAQIVNQVLPGGVLGDAGRAVRARGTAGLLVSGQAVLFERLAGQVALFALFATAVVVTRLVPGGFAAPPWLLSIALLPPLAIAALLQVTRAGTPGVTAEHRAMRALRGLIAAFRHAVTAPPVRARQLAMSLATALCNVAAFACCAAAVGVSLPASMALILVPLILFSMLIPVTISGWGLREGAAAALLPLAGATGAEGLAASIAFGITVLLAASPGALALAPADGPDRHGESPG